MHCIELPKLFKFMKSRILLWKSWQAGNIEGSVALLWDDKILRAEPMLRNYWWFRDWGWGDVAQANLREHLGQVTHLPISTSSKLIIYLDHTLGTSRGLPSRLACALSCETG
jgi:hypothetical protein